jgi:hypothetical protein
MALSAPLWGLVVCLCVGVGLGKEGTATGKAMDTGTAS